MTPIEFRYWFLNWVRRGSYRLRARSQALAAARTARNTYTCAKCQASFSKKEIQLDHIIPVIDPATGFPLNPDGTDDWNTIIRRVMITVPEGWQVLCKPCHQKKSNEENSKRDRKRKKPTPV